MITTRMAWKDWGFAESIFSQSKHFLDLAKQNTTSSIQEGYIRASIVFSLMSFEAYFGEVVRGYIQQRGATINNPTGLKKVENGLRKHNGIHAAVRDWPKYLTGNSLDTTTKSYADFVNFTQYRNALVHGNITEKIPSWGKLAQDVETIDNAELAQGTILQMIKVVAAHFGFNVPTWT